ncbi:hypothetical protein BGZ90_005349 [Linnemannia elongata]|nr:hypothetical protein BGZ90_005349 [Linnemannia elongata]
MNASRVKDRLYQQKDQGLPVQHKNRDSFNQPQDKDRPGQQEAGSKEDSGFEELDRYQKDAIDTMRRRQLKKTDPADTMYEVFKFDHKMNNSPTLAIQELGALQDHRLRMLFEHLIMNLPRKEQDMQSEETLVVNNIAPILKTFVNHVEDDIHTHFPNTESTTQKKQGLKADRPDFKVLIGDKEASFGEVTGRCQRTDKAKNGWDMWRLVRFGKSVLDEGAPMVPLIQVIYDEGTIYRHFVKIRGVMVLAEVGVFTVPTHLNQIGSLQASLPVLFWYQGAVKWLEFNREWTKRSWKSADLENIKKYHC